MIGFHPRECSKSQLSLLAALVFAQRWGLWVRVGEKELEGKDQSLPSGTSQSALMSQHSMQRKTVTVMDNALLFIQMQCVYIFINFSLKAQQKKKKLECGIRKMLYQNLLLIGVFFAPIALIFHSVHLPSVY